MTLLEKLSSIHKPTLCNLPSGAAQSIEELWEGLIKRYIPQPNVVLAWHDLLMHYIHSQHPTFAIRGYNSFPREKYSELRRGFLTNAGDFSFFYTDNFFAAYFQKMALDGYVPQLDEFIAALDNREFPSRFGMNTSEERELLAVKQGKDPKINAAGFKVAHIVPVGQEYNFNNRILRSNEILRTYFPNGNRSDWTLKHSDNGLYYEREFTSVRDRKQYAISHFLRFVHPFNYFLCPKKSCEDNDRCKELAEYPALLHYVHDYNLTTYGNKYLEFLSYSMPLDKYYSQLYSSSDSKISVKFGLNINKTENPISSPQMDQNIHATGSRLFQLANITDSNAINIDMAIEYLSNPNTSFRKLEVQFLHIDSAARGGGFISKKIINSMGITAEQKGILKQVSLDDLIGEARGTLLSTLQRIKSII